MPKSKHRKGHKEKSRKRTEEIKKNVEKIKNNFIQQLIKAQEQVKPELEEQIDVGLGLDNLVEQPNEEKSE